jgi:hypothetical protein
MEGPEQLRLRADQLYNLALQIRDSAPAHADMLAEEATELQERATAIENANNNNTPARPSEPTQPNVQIQEQIPLKTDE